MTSNEHQVQSPQMTDLIDVERTICDAQLRAFKQVLDVCFPTPGGSE